MYLRVRDILKRDDASHFLPSKDALFAQSHVDLNVGSHAGVR
jgi:hypothetical protein